ncbi:hypothetical protein F5Y17DRAFT_465961 [Xylariaceae sp. FL0594]|nr:hypothetical protein F5Y17DRAFT_465961 [Xylariaceae sp. FL0594]
MASVVGAVRRNWRMTHPPEIAKTSKPLRFGILGAADIGPAALIQPAKSHPDVVVHAVAARDPAKAEAYAQKHGIPTVAQTYQDILDDPSIDCVYIPLPNGLHYEWAQRSLRAGKHVLLEKPSVNNSTEASRLFIPTSPTAASPASPRPILLEAAHPYFHPAWALFMAQVTPDAVASAKASLWVPHGMFGYDDIRYSYDLGGGALMDLGAYTASALVRIMGGSVASECLSCETAPGAAPADPRCDQWYKVRYSFPNGAIGEMEGDLRAPVSRILPKISVKHKPVEVSQAEAGLDGLEEGDRIVRTRQVRFSNYPQPTIFHSITVEDEFELQRSGSATKTWKRKRALKGYSWREVGLASFETQPGDVHWTTYRYQLEQFVNRVRGRDTPQWVESRQSVTTMGMIDMAYTKANLPLRPTSEYE